MLAKVSTAFRNSLERHLGRIDLHGGQVFVMFELWKTDGLRQIDLAKGLDLSAPTVNKTVKGLVELGLVTSSRIDNDARSTRIFLTDRGRRMRAQIEAQWIEVEEECLSGISEVERLMLLELLNKLRNSYTGRSPSEDDE
jgi:MarR family transcriptional regulator, organic hydroperoxide resistance regulator